MLTTISRESRQDIADLLVRYATAIDLRDWELFRTCFTDDCEATYAGIGSWVGVDAITQWMVDTHSKMGATLHRITNQAVTSGPEGVKSRSYVDVIALNPDGQFRVRAVGYYDDDLVQTDEEWKIARRHYTMVHAGRDSS
jgi:3-phenylpropionate/cinnamic acid dioxygenase small subunit